MHPSQNNHTTSLVAQSAFNMIEERGENAWKWTRLFFSQKYNWRSFVLLSKIEEEKSYLPFHYKQKICFMFYKHKKTKDMKQLAFVTLDVTDKGQKSLKDEKQMRQTL